MAIFLNLNYITRAGVQPKDMTVNAAYPCEQGQNDTKIITEITLLAAVSWAVWRIECLLGR